MLNENCFLDTFRGHNIYGLDTKRDSKYICGAYCKAVLQLYKVEFSALGEIFLFGLD